MPPHTLAKRLERLQQAYAAQIKKPVASRFLPFSPDHTVEDYDRLQEEELDRMIADGEIRANQRRVVRFIRWLTREEHGECKLREVNGPVPAPVHVQADTARVDPVPARETMVSSVPVSASADEEDEQSVRFNRPLNHPDLGII